MNEIEHNHEHVNCREYLSTLGEYVDGTLDQNLCAELERHMKDCKRCRIVVNTLKKTVELYHETADDMSLPEDVRQRLFVRLNLDDYLRRDHRVPEAATHERLDQHAAPQAVGVAKIEAGFHARTER